MDVANRDPTSNLLTMIQSNMDFFNEDDAVGCPAIFTYSFGSGTDKEVPKRIACNNSGTRRAATEEEKIHINACLSKLKETQENVAELKRGLGV